MTANVAIRGSVDRVAKGHVVGRHGFRHRPRRSANMKKAAGYFLASADFRESTVALCVEINLERFFVGP